MNFGLAIEALKAGKRVMRIDWLGTGKFLYLVKQSVVDKEILRNEALKQPISGDFGLVTFLPHIDMFTENETVLVGWQPNSIDMLAEDWNSL